MSQSKSRSLVFGIHLFLLIFCVSMVQAVTTPIPAQPGQDIICTGPYFTYLYDVRERGVDPNMVISGAAGFGVETAAPGALASYYTDTTYSGSTAVFQYSFVAEAGKLLGDVSVASRANIYSGGTIVGDYKIGDGDWVQFLLAMSGETRLIDIFEEIHNERFTVRYTVSWTAQWADHAQLFRSWSPAPGEPGDYAFKFTASVIGDTDCHTADLAGDSVFVDLADFAVLASDYGLTEPGLAGDLDGDGTCNIADLQWLFAYWGCDCYNVCP